MEEKYTFSSLISYILNLENRAAEFYKSIARKVKSKELSLFLLSLSERYLRNAELISRKRRETVIEMALEPISGLNLNSYTIQINNTISSESIDNLDKAIQLNKILEVLYSEASSKIASMSPDTSELLSRLSREKNVERKKLEEFKHT